MCDFLPIGCDISQTIQDRMNPNPVFKVIPLFDAKYLTNGYRYSYSYYRR